MGNQARELAQRFTAFNQEVIAFVETCPENAWQTLCRGEGWSVGVVAHHIAARHYAWLRLAELLVAGEEVAHISLEAVNRANERHAREHTHITPDEVLDLLEENGAAIAEFLARLNDSSLNHATDFPPVQGRVTTRQIIEWLIIHMGRQHLASMQAAAAA